ncbi:neuropeptides capa receptor-like isoform X2 [Daktulosphaira vitifoliae]|uniref:neuropeptides capa receptor-like isoform X2 n=1 Tax=Daktulosphaira vitifoliae TaxID=58002 RepID=UPI0021A9D48C|nr:neuropeptides capa receptor-like isoform X2 [Daktulosphaira vitifoliae]XP_050522512.1 neuropeptides capa receptor-like isoform X2 [Daktulosphaira vitifoliae]
MKFRSKSCLPNDLSVYWQQYPWPLGEFICKLRALVSEMTSYTSVLTIVAFSMERYIAICHPLHAYAMSGLKRAIRIIAMVWIISFLAALPFAVYTKVDYIEYPPASGNLSYESAFCAMLDSNLPPGVPIYELSSFLFFLVPLIIIIVLYERIGHQIRQSSRHSLGKQMHGGDNKQIQSKKSIVRMLAAVVVAFFLCWAPFHAQRLLYRYARESPYFPLINELLYTIAGCFYYFSSTVNPILYNLMSMKYRRAFRETLCGNARKYRNRMSRDLQSSFRDTTMPINTIISTTEYRKSVIHKPIVTKNGRIADDGETESSTIAAADMLVMLSSAENGSAQSYKTLLRTNESKPSSSGKIHHDDEIVNYERCQTENNPSTLEIETCI